jgi:hypothetical protein
MYTQNPDGACAWRQQPSDIFFWKLACVSTRSPLMHQRATLELDGVGFIYLNCFCSSNALISIRSAETT